MSIKEAWGKKVFSQVVCPISVTSARQNNSRRVPLSSVSSQYLSHALRAVRGQWRKRTYKHCRHKIAKIWLWMTARLRVCEALLCFCFGGLFIKGRNGSTNQVSTSVTSAQRKRMRKHHTVHSLKGNKTVGCMIKTTNRSYTCFHS